MPKVLLPLSQSRCAGLCRRNSDAHDSAPVQNWGSSSIVSGKKHAAYLQLVSCEPFPFLAKRDCFLQAVGIMPQLCSKLFLSRGNTTKAIHPERNIFEHSWLCKTTMLQDKNKGLRA